MFRNWLNENKIDNFDFSGQLFPKAKDRKFWQSKFQKQYITEAEKLIGCDWPIIRATAYMEFFKSGDRKCHENPHFARRRALGSLVMGEVMEHKGRFLPDIVDGLFAICEETYWGVSAHALPLIHKEAENLPNITSHVIDLFAAETAELISVVYYLLYDELYDFCPEILDRIEYEMNTRIIHPYSNRKDYWWMGYNGPTNNWNAWIISNILTVFLLIPTTKTVFYNAIAKMLFEINTFYASMPDDGGCDEGASYWNMSGGKLFEFCEQIYLATNGAVNFFGDTKVQNIGKYIYRVYIGDNYVTNFADGSPNLQSGMKYILYMFGKRIGDSRLSSLAGECVEEFSHTSQIAQMKRKIYTIIYNDEIQALPKFSDDEQHLLPDLQVSAIHCGKWFYAAKGGHNKEWHNHNDVGSFIAYYDNRPVLIDPSCGVYTRQTFMVTERYKIWTMQSLWHNLPVVNGCAQLSEYDEHGGLEARADSFTLDGKTTDISFAKAYPQNAGVDKISRSIGVSDCGITVCDNFVFANSENTVCEHFITVLDVKIDGADVILGGKFRLTAENCDISVDSVDFCGDQNLTKYWQTDHLNRIKFNFDCKENKNIEFKLVKIEE